MSTTQGDSSYTYCTEGKSPKAVNVLKEAMCMPTVDSSKEEREKFCSILDHYKHDETEDNN